MELSEIRKKSVSQLQKSLQDLREKLRDIRFRVTSNKLKNVGEVKETKKEIARILTVLNEKNKGK